MNNKLKIYGIEVILSILLFIVLIFNKELNSRFLVAIILLSFLIIAKLILKKKIIFSVHKNNVLKLMCIMAIIYVGILYTLGIYSGFYNSTVKFGTISIIKYIFPITMIICCSEYIRNKFLSIDNKISSVLNFIIQVIIDILMYSNIYILRTLDDLMLVIGYVLFASIACNLVYNYISKRYGAKPNIIYRIITTLYIYIIPITPDIYIFFLSFYRMLYPYLIYYVIESYYGEKESSMSLKSLKRLKIISTICFIVLCIYIGLISCMFTYGALVIGSGSMTGTIDKGDVIIFRKNIKEENVNVGDIIIFKQNNSKIVHRVVDKKKDNNQYRFYTKGDNNIEIDKGYVTSKDLYGTVCFKIKDIGLPTIWLHNIFDRVK